jgi:hypothetical protein
MRSRSEAKRSAAAVVAALMLTLTLAAPAPAGAASSRAHQEALFMQTVDTDTDANATVGNLTGNAGKHVAFDCFVEEVIRNGIMIGQCGNPDEPIDVFVKLPTAGLRIADHLRVLGVMEQPAVWADVTGHPVYYAFLRAVFVDRVDDGRRP